MRKRRQIELAATLLFSHFDPYFQQLMRSTQNEKTELLTQKNRLKRRLFKVIFAGVRGLEPRASCSQTYRENFLCSFIAVFSAF